jgi:hypothetical protein
MYAAKSFRGLNIILIIIIAFSINARAQLSGVKVSAGLSTAEIIGNNIAQYPLIWDTPDGKIYGGSFDQSQNGLRLEGNFSLDTGEIFEIPIGFEYIFFKGRERQPISDSSDIKFKHDVDVAIFSLGFFYSFYEIYPFKLKAKFYTGVDTRTSFISQGRYEASINYTIDNPEVIAYDTKEAAIRFGGAIILGLNGEINEKVGVDFRAGLGMMNLLGKNDERGELFTPRKKTGDYEEKGESSVFNFHFAMMIQFKL